MSEPDPLVGNIELLDTRGLLCPLPVIRTQDRVKRLPVGTLLDVFASDPGALHDIPAWCRIHGHDVVETQRVEREIRIRVRVRHAR
jgi:tRNA 2-thiouridine synthesizing protein A